MAEENVVWSERQLQNHLRLFPTGQLVAIVDEQIVGAVASLIVQSSRDPYRAHTYGGITDGGYFHNHDPHGDTLYGADVYVDPACQGRGIGAALYEARRRLCKQLNLRRILAGGRISGYATHEKELSPEAYIQKVKDGEIHDNVLSFQLKQGFLVRGILRNYIVDPMSHNLASLIEWLNPDYTPKEISSKVRIACVQYKVRKIENFDDFANQVEYFVETAADYKADFVLFPEFFSVQLLSVIEPLSAPEGIRKLAAEFTEPFIELMSRMASKYGVYIIGGSHPIQREDKLQNECLIFDPDGRYVAQPKLHITPAEKKYWGISGGHELIILPTPKAKIAVQICYDVEFPEASRYLADQGVEILFVPYCTDDRHGQLRVRYCAQARAIENQFYVATAGIIGNLPSVPAMDIHYGQAAVFTPSDFEFARDGIQAIADSNVETLLVTDIDTEDLYRSRASGSVTPRLDRRTDLFEMKVHLKNLDTSNELTDAPEIELPK
ncbi:MAG: bifunctional GNAT family N-acetyltransferase/carbon-nitrogen hydrolase family protein [Opitutales bacterium]|jgi:predicted amidohydrolase/GNAT superfamily N-acetyltransferase|nr:bifunctional GNAT family N-acetyltransferase/carbon-nitrogen hydrolase family protein [Opitutales bacterium]MDP4778562.1 bifunctional GNAT family N-acetyltransferase/carbon-nitrogen hydrolase family protein [Opitutales bacterium]MDP4883786.1 bifunctional GNAT family N-acetyltransferase/carbon-nitrogen hydrolase family protein [Opitutales bacterium]MDP5080843.1 bifunctional GNAT family N-acetyltransferase/carbon-nitrogen hydrolase family protein [Opitutales bacterium]